MFDERAFIARVEAADTEELAELLARPSLEEEKALRLYLGDERFQRMRGLAVQGSATRGARNRATRDRKRNVIVIPGIMGSELAAVDRGGDLDPIWVKALRLMFGAVGRLRLREDGLGEFDPDYDIRATGIMKRYYGELLLSLAQSWTVRAFWFDWRKDLSIAADELNARISGWFGPDDPVHIVAHSMGGLVARTFIKRHPDSWKRMGSDASSGRSGGRLIMLGTPNHGSFAIPQTITGIEKTVRWLSAADVRHSFDALLTVLNSFVGNYQMLPSPLVMPKMAPLYDAATYGALNVPQRHLDNALRHHHWLADVVDSERMVYVAGYNQATFCDISDFQKLGDRAAYKVTTMGDGRVPHELGLLEKDGKGKVPTYYVEHEHSCLPASRQLLAILDDLLVKGSTTELRDTVPAGVRLSPDSAALQALADAEQEDEVRLRAAIERLRARVAARRSRRGRLPRTASVSTPVGTATVEPASAVSEEAAALPHISRDERLVEEALTQGFLATSALEGIENPIQSSGCRSPASGDPSTGLPQDPEP